MGCSPDSRALRSQVMVSASPGLVLDGPAPAIYAPGTQFNVSLHRPLSGNTAAYTIHTAKLQFGEMRPAGMTALGGAEISASGGTVLSFGTHFPGVSVAGFGSSDAVCVDGMLVQGQSVTPAPTTPAPSVIGCVSRIGAGCGTGCCRGLVCQATSVRGASTAETCQLPVAPPTAPNPVVINGGPDDEAIELGRSKNGDKDHSLVTLLSGVALIVVGIVAAAIVAWRYHRNEEDRLLFRGSEVYTEAPLQRHSCIEYASVYEDTDYEYASSFIAPRLSLDSLPGQVARRGGSRRGSGSFSGGPRKPPIRSSLATSVAFRHHSFELGGVQPTQVMCADTNA